MLARHLSICFIAVLCALASCKGSGAASSSAPSGDTIDLKYTANLTMIDRDGYTEAVVRNPWDTTKTLATYLLVPSNSALPAEMPEGTVIRTPVTNALVYSTVHNSLIRSLGAIDAIGGVCNGQYINSKDIQARIRSGRVADCGNSMTPDLEKILMLRPQVIMLSPFENNDRYGKVADLGIPIVECADYMEQSPLGRAEWVKFYGRLLGREKEADKMFEETEARYIALRDSAGKAEGRPAVIIDQRYGQVWNVPGGASTMAAFIRDAGGTNPFDEYPQSGSVAIAPEEVLVKAHDAPIWLVRYNQANDKSLEELAQDASVNSHFEAYRKGNVYGCNTRYIDFYEEVPFHPDYLLEDMISIIHPESGVIPSHPYYSKMK